MEVSIILDGRPPPPADPVVSEPVAPSVVNGVETLVREEDLHLYPGNSLKPILTPNERYIDRFAKVPSSIYSTLMDYQMPQVKAVFLSILGSANYIVDATAHIGGDAIHLSQIYPMSRILAIDIDPNAITCLLTNVKALADSSRFDIVLADSVKYISDNNPKADLYYFDPPWGGPSYMNQRKVYLYLGDVRIVDVVNYVLENGLTNHVVVKVPRNFAYSEFKEHLRGVCEMHLIRKLQKRGSVAYGLVHATRSPTK